MANRASGARVLNCLVAAVPSLSRDGALTRCGSRCSHYIKAHRGVGFGSQLRGFYFSGTSAGLVVSPRFSWQEQAGGRLPLLLILYNFQPHSVSFVRAQKREWQTAPQAPLSLQLCSSWFGGASSQAPHPSLPQVCESSLVELALLSAKGHARLTCSVASAVATARCRGEPFAGLFPAARPP